jgi:hypothetical protein
LVEGVLDGDGVGHVDLVDPGDVEDADDNVRDFLLGAGEGGEPGGLHLLGLVAGFVEGVSPEGLPKLGDLPVEVRHVAGHPEGVLLWVVESLGGGDLVEMVCEVIEKAEGSKVELHAPVYTG